MKEFYNEVELEVVRFDAEDVVVTSSEELPTLPCENELPPVPFGA